MSGNLVRKLALTLFVANTLSVFIIIELLIWHIPYGSIFIVIFGVTAYYNLQLLSASRSDRTCEVVDGGEDGGNQEPDSESQNDKNRWLN